MNAKLASGLLVLGLAACGSAPSTTLTTLTGLGATVDVWNAHHDDSYSSVVTDASGRVQGYVVTMSPRALSQAEDLIRMDLPPDARASQPQLMVGIEGTTCEIVDFTSPSLGRVLGGKHGAEVLVAFEAENNIAMDTNRIAHAVVASGNEQLPRRC